MKRCFENPEVELLKFAVADVITTSGEEECGMDFGASMGMGNCV